MDVVLVYSLAFGINKKFSNIIIYGLTKDSNNKKIINDVKYFLKINRLNTKILIK